MINELTSEEKAELIAAATEALDKAYAPYSNFRVGAAVLTEKGEIFAGCNVENASYGLSVCAERNAIAHAIIKMGKITVKAIAVANSQKVPCSPCGACRQVIWEFGKHTEVIFWGDGDWQSRAIADLLPAGFSF